MTDDFLIAVEAALVKTKMAPSRFGFEALGERQFVFQIRAGREPRRATRERVLAYIRRLESMTNAESPAHQDAAPA